MIRIILIDDHTLIRTGFRQMLSAVKGIEIVGEAGTGQEGIELARQLEPDLVLLDLRLPDIDGLAVAERLVRKNINVRILVVSSVIEDLTVLRLLEAGAGGYISKNASTEEFMQAIQAVYNGKRFIGTKLASRLALTQATTDPVEAFAKITDREREVIDCIIRGMEVKDIAVALKINYKTVHSFRERIFKKLDIDSDMALAILAIRHGLITVDSK